MSRPLRVLQALETSGPGGAEHVLLRLADALRAAGDDVHIAAMRPGWMTERAEARGLPVWIVPQRPGPDLPWILRLARRLRRERIDVVHTHEYEMNVYAGLAARLARIPCVATLHGAQWGTAHRRHILGYRILRGLGAQLVSVSRHLGTALSDSLAIPATALAVIHNGIPLPDLPPASERAAARSAARARAGLPLDGPLLLAVGNLYPVKDHASLLRAAAKLPGARVAIAGRGDEAPRLRELAGELGISERLHLLGLRDDVDALLAAADVFVQPSRAEGLPLAVLEAMAAGLPVVASDVGGISEALRDGESGRLVPAGDVSALERALGEVLADPGRAASWGAAARSRVEREFSLEGMAARYRDCYRAQGAA